MYDNTVANIFTIRMRSIMAWIDKGIYILLAFMYEIFFNVANADLFTNAMVFHFYKRVQLIIGVYMVFQLAIIIMKGIFNTDEVSGKSNNEFVKRVIVVLVLLTVLTPISIPNASNEYEEQLNDNGLLFGTLYSLQWRILQNNTIGRLVLGTNDTVLDSDVEDGTSSKKLTYEEKLTKSANLFSATMLKGFVRINLIPEDLWVPYEEDQAPEVKNNNRMCTNISDPDLEQYLSDKSTPSEILDLVDRTCVPSTSAANRKNLNKAIGAGLTSRKRFQFSYHLPLISTVVGIAFIFLFISITIDVAIRAIKLAVLRLIAPIPIISYMDPKGSKDSGFNAWVKALTTTYLELFIRLATVYFVIFLIQDMISTGVRISKASGVVGALSFVFICIGLIFFAKEAPKFIQQVLGLKSEPMNLFGRTMATGGALVGMIGSGVANYRAAKEENEALHKNSSFNVLRNAGSAIAGAIAGGGVGLAAAQAKDANLKKLIEAQSARNARRAGHSTLPGRVADDMYFLTHGRSLATRDQGLLDAASAAYKSIGTWKDSLKAEARKNGRTGSWRGMDFNISALEQAMEGADSRTGNFDYTDMYGHTYKGLNVRDFTKEVRDAIEDDQTKNWINGATGYKPDGTTPATSYTKIITKGGKLYNAHNQVVYDTQQAGITFNERDYENLGSKMGEANTIVSNMSTNMKNIKHRANKQGKS